MERNEWNKAYATRIQERSGMEQKFAMESAEGADDPFVDGEDPIDAADEEMSCWDE